MFDDIIGNSFVKTQLKKILEKNLSTHAYLFIGPEGIGKRKIAHRFARTLLAKHATSKKECAPAETKIASQEIEELFDAGNHPNLLTLQREEGKRDIPVSLVRELCSTLQLKPYHPGPNIALIDNAERMSIASCNAFLKTLEEPPGHAYIFLISSSPQRLPETIVSRCQCFNFSPLSQEEFEQLIGKLFSTDAKRWLPRFRSLGIRSLEFLPLSDLTDPKTLLISDQKEALKRTDLFLSEAEEISQRLDKNLNEENENARGSQAVVDASEISSDKNLLPLAFFLLRDKIHRRLKSPCPPSRQLHFSKLLTDAEEAQNLIRERSLNPALRLSALLS